MLLTFILWAGMLFQANNLEVHPFHTSLTELHFNSRSNSWELSIRLFTDDFEKGLSEFHKKNLNLDNNNEGDTFIPPYIAKHFGFIESGKLKHPFQYLGYDVQTDVTWVYAEWNYSQDLLGKKLENSLLMEEFDNQINIVQKEFKENKSSYIFKKSSKLTTLK